MNLVRYLKYLMRIQRKDLLMNQIKQEKEELSVL